MTGVRRGRLLLFLVALGGAGARLAAGQEPPVADARAAAEALAAEQAVERTRATLAASREALEALVHELQDDFAALTAADAGARRQALVLALRDALAPAEARLAAATAQGKPLMRQGRTQVLVEAFRPPLREASALDDRFLDWIAARVAEPLAARTSFSGVDEAELGRLLDGLFVPGETWAEFWNRSFHVDLPQSAAYTGALAAYEEAGLTLDRLRRPERYGPRGEPAPPGMLIVPGGSYTLGPNAGWPRPRRKLVLQPFAIDRHEVTRREYAVFVDSLAAQPSVQAAVLPRGWSLSPTGRAQYDEQLRDHPVVYVDWNAAAAYAAWAGKRLPTEDEWEAAAAGVDGLAFPWGNEYQPGRCQGGAGAGASVPVESFPEWRSAAGCYDMAGNVWEWTATLDDGTDIRQLPPGLVNVAIRGGAYDSPRDELSTRFRWTAPGQQTFAAPNYSRPIGFRCAADL